MIIRKFKNIDIDYVDGILIVDNTGKIVHSVRYNPRFNENAKEKEYRDFINKNYLEAYPGLEAEESTIINCLKDGVPIYKKNQVFCDYEGRVYNTQNLTIPIIRRGKVLGAIELSKDITSIQDLSEAFENVESVKAGTTGDISKKNIASVKYSFEDIITKNDEMLENIEKAKLIADSPSSILVYGETGTGKELFVQSIHNYSSRRNRPFIAQNCAALPENLFESILFGSVKGSFTGAMDKQGLFEIANGGTLFLDEINSMSMNLQAKLLRVLQDGVVRRIGDSKDRKVDVRVISAMNMDPMEAINKRYIREDIFYRLSVMSIKLVPLRKRKEDILLLVRYFLKKYNTLLKRYVKRISKEVETLFFVYHWPGNIRELQHVIEGAMNIVKDGIIEMKHLPVYLSETAENIYFYDEEEVTQPLNDVIEVIEKKMIIKALEKAGGNVSKAAKFLDIPRQTLQYKIIKYNILIE
ncbi:sigma-54 interaction domain-containing protein [Marinisporobacter balticus]|uniref:Arginine utilization regulatory protein n=1 Tax=Marinisporobacter balticus TaxID=2018667 RepID=A0A4R2KIJ5_9FIRM|nr:sigma 54-interacting transcriptional regulator [Marinisporobacter balticus]TCO72312.1 arginine utilization regulatory protein [Marinisporobacter balticus]